MDGNSNQKAREHKTDTRKFFRELLGLFLLFWAIFLAVGLLSYSANDPSLNHVVSSKNLVHNKAGLFGAYAAGFLNDVFGAGSLLWPFVFGALGATYLSAHYSFLWWRWCGFFLLTVCFLVCGSAFNFRIGELAGGGMVGYSLYANSTLYLSPVGSFLLWFFIFIAGVQLSFNFSWINLAGNIISMYRERYDTAAKTANETAAGSTAKTRGWKTFCDRADRFFPVPDKIKKLLKDNCSLLGQGLKNLISGHKTASSSAIAESAGLTEEDKFYAALDAPNNDDTHASSHAVPVANLQTAESQDIPFSDTQAPALNTMSSGAAKIGRESHAPANSKNNPPANLVSPAQDAPENSRKNKEIELPPLAILQPPKSGAVTISATFLENKSRKLIDALKDFGIESELVRITPGPVVTMFEIHPAAGIKGSRIVGLAGDLSRALSAVSVRIQAPIPGKDTIGIEIPNEERQIVNFRELAETDKFRQGCGPLTMIIGKDIAGEPYFADLTQMPHLLVAGATGAGKSVCLNCILISLLYRRKPDEMQLLLVDPKRIEMTLYADSPHLVHPVVTETSEAKNALDWALHEMDRRYEAIARLGVRDIKNYNQKIASYGNKPPAIFADLQKLPYIVIVIDELADLMMTASREVEPAIVRLAQLARAAGIHLILATQRPSVDVVTGLIKANFPCRISFQVTSKPDSRTILDQTGAEHLLGHGDMLFKPRSGLPVRLHGPFLSDEECAAVINHWKRQQAPEYKIDFNKWTAEQAAQQSCNVDATDDPLYEEARKFILNHGFASTSLLQRQFRLGFNRASRIIGQFENEGLIGPAEGSKPRPVIYPSHS